jgi:hypothetical protein
MQCGLWQCSEVLSDIGASEAEREVAGLLSASREEVKLVYYPCHYKVQPASCSSDIFPSRGKLITILMCSSDQGIVEVWSSNSTPRGAGMRRDIEIRWPSFEWSRAVRFVIN